MKKLLVIFLSVFGLVYFSGQVWAGTDIFPDSQVYSWGTYYCQGDTNNYVPDTNADKSSCTYKVAQCVGDYLACVKQYCTVSIDSKGKPQWSCDSGNTIKIIECNQSADEFYKSSIAPICSVSNCGNQIVEVGEQCDDGNSINGDGCSTSCSFDASGNVPAPVCGNNMTETGEDCDHGPNGDSTCTSQCKNRILFPFTANTYTYQPAGPTQPPTSVCGDGNREATEECDDGNTVDFDGCSALCMLPTVQPSNPSNNNKDIPSVDNGGKVDTANSAVASGTGSMDMSGGGWVSCSINTFNQISPWTSYVMFFGLGLLPLVFRKSKDVAQKILK